MYKSLLRYTSEHPFFLFLLKCFLGNQWLYCIDRIEMVPVQVLPIELLGNQTPLFLTNYFNPCRCENIRVFENALILVFRFCFMFYFEVFSFHWYLADAFIQSDLYGLQNCRLTAYRSNLGLSVLPKKMSTSQKYVFIIVKVTVDVVIVMIHILKPLFHTNYFNSSRSRRSENIRVLEHALILVF